MRGRRLLNSTVLGELLDRVAPLGCLDIGARRGPTPDLLPLASACEIACFEPDPDECEALNRRFANDTTWGAIRFLPEALSEKGGIRRLHLTRARGCSTMLEPILEVGRRFSREDYVLVDETIDVSTTTLDEAAARYQLQDTSYLKIDVEGLELEILRSGTTLLASSVQAIRCEVNFLPVRMGQPSYADLHAFLDGFGFRPMGFCELHEWRRRSGRRGEDRTGRLAFSRGQLAHGDMLFLRAPEAIEGDDGQRARRLVHNALLALDYDFADHAQALLHLPEAQPVLGGVSPSAVDEALEIAARSLRKRSRARARTRRLRSVGRWLAGRNR